MAERIVYAVCDDDCRFPTMTKEEILAAIEQALEQGYVSDPDGAVFSKIKEIRAGGTAQLWVGTEAEFNAISPAPTVGTSLVRVGADGTLYLCRDDNSLASMAEHLESKENPHGVTAEQVGAAKSDHEHTAEEVGALSANGGNVRGLVNFSADGGFRTVRIGSNIKFVQVDPAAGWAAGMTLRNGADTATLGGCGFLKDEGDALKYYYVGANSENPLFKMLPDGTITLAKALPVESGGTGAANPADALKNLGIFIQAEEPASAPEGSIWIKLAE